jgi:hypothetical protein
MPWGPNPRIIRLATPTTSPASRPTDQPFPRPPADRDHARPLDNTSAISERRELVITVPHPEQDPALDAITAALDVPDPQAG